MSVGTTLLPLKPKHEEPDPKITVQEEVDNIMFGKDPFCVLLCMVRESTG